MDNSVGYYDSISRLLKCICQSRYYSGGVIWRKRVVLRSTGRRPSGCRVRGLTRDVGSVAAVGRRWLGEAGGAQRR